MIALLLALSLHLPGELATQARNDLSQPEALDCFDQQRTTFDRSIAAQPLALHSGAPAWTVQGTGCLASQAGPHILVYARLAGHWRKILDCFAPGLQVLAGSTQGWRDLACGQRYTFTGQVYAPIPH